MKVLTATVLLIASMAVSAAPPRVTIATKDVQAVLIYLAERPYKEVFQLVPALVNAQSVKEPEPEEVTKKRPQSRKSKESK